MPTTTTTFHCNDCGQTYDVYNHAIQCEKSHLHIGQLAVTKTEHMGPDARWPLRITVKAEAGYGGSRIYILEKPGYKELKK